VVRRTFFSKESWTETRSSERERRWSGPRRPVGGMAQPPSAFNSLYPTLQGFIFFCLCIFIFGSPVGKSVSQENNILSIYFFEIPATTTTGNATAPSSLTPRTDT
jgi:hypothetical protein